MIEDFVEPVAQRQFTEFKYDLCDCCHDCGVCLYVWCLPCFAIADLSLIIEPCCIREKIVRWWVIFMGIIMYEIVTGGISHFIFQNDITFDSSLLNDMTFDSNSLLTFILLICVGYIASVTIAEKIGYAPQNADCCCCLEYTFCSCCKFIQVVNQLSIDKQGVQCPETIQLVSEIKEHALLPCCLCKIHNVQPNQHNEGESTIPIHLPQQELAEELESRQIPNLEEEFIL